MRPERLIAVAWGARQPNTSAAYSVDLLVEADDRQGLLRDISELLAKEKMNVVGVHRSWSRTLEAALRG